MAGGAHCEAAERRLTDQFLTWRSVEPGEAARGQMVHVDQTFHVIQTARQSADLLLRYGFAKAGRWVVGLRPFGTTVSVPCAVDVRPSSPTNEPSGVAK